MSDEQVGKSGCGCLLVIILFATGAISSCPLWAKIFIVLGLL